MSLPVPPQSGTSSRIPSSTVDKLPRNALVFTYDLFRHLFICRYIPGDIFRLKEVGVPRG
jgi:hypothetical protein